MPVKDSDHVLTIGSRGSKLAVIQAKMVETSLRRAFPGLVVSFKTVTTTGDRDRNRSLDVFGGQGVFVKELEQALTSGEIDLAVHSLKDVPTELGTGLKLSATLPREDPRDVLVSRSGLKLALLPMGSWVGTDSRRRAAQLKAVRPDIATRPIRGNIDTRLRKVRMGEVDGVILAAAALLRLGWPDRITEFLPVDSFLPAVGQGAVAVEIRSDDKMTDRITSSVNDLSTWQAVLAERAFMRTLGGGCRAPIAALATVADGYLTIDGMVASMDYATIVRDRNAGPAEQAEAIGAELARMALDGEGKRIVYESGGLNVSTG